VKSDDKKYKLKVDSMKKEEKKKRSRKDLTDKIENQNQR